MNTDSQNIEELRREEIQMTTFRPHITTKQPPQHPKAADHGEVKSVPMTLTQMQEQVISLVASVQKRVRKNKAERYEAGLLLFKIREQMTVIDPTLSRFGHPVAFWKWIHEHSGLSQSQAHEWMYFAKNGKEQAPRQPSRERITYWQSLDKKMKTCTTDAEKLGHFLEAITYLQKSYGIRTKVSLAQVATVGEAVRSTLGK